MNKALYKLLALKETDLRIDTIRQCGEAIDHGLHIGGAYSALIPLTALYYGGFIDAHVEDPTASDRDAFVLSKGHAVAALASVYADLGYFDKKLLSGSRSIHATLKGHPGPVLPGVLVSTGPLGHGTSIACGLAATRQSYGADVYCMTGDGELQEGSNWEGVLYAADHHLDNICVMVDRNHGQSDNSYRLVVELGDLEAKFEAFGFRTIVADGTAMESCCEALAQFRFGRRDGRPTAIIFDTKKGFGGATDQSVKHKATLSDAVVEGEIAQLSATRALRVNALIGESAEGLADAAALMNYKLDTDTEGRIRGVEQLPVQVKIRKAAPRDKALRYSPEAIAPVEYGKPYLADDIVKLVMKEMAKDPRVISIDADLGNTSGLFPGVAQVDMRRALNAGIAEAHMMNMAEGYAVDGCSVFCSTFAVFFDWRAMRRIAVSCQERAETMAMPDGWLNKGHGLDITFVATAPNFGTQVNGATHMGVDDNMIFNAVPGLKMIDVCCPQQLRRVLEWIAEGDKGLVYLRMPRIKFSRIYPDEYRFEYGKAAFVNQAKDPDVYIVSNGRGVIEALRTVDMLGEKGVRVQIVDMPSVDEETLLRLADSGKSVWFCEQNYGYLMSHFSETAARAGRSVDYGRIHAMNCRDENGDIRFIHSGTYAELTEMTGLTAEHITERILADL